MACFLVPATEAIVTTIATKIIEKKEKNQKTIGIKLDDTHTEEVTKIPFSRKLKWLNNLLWGGSALLMFEHLWHGEIAPYFPFLTAASNPKDLLDMFHEMATTGVTMALLVTAIWGGMLIVSSAIEKKAEKEAKDALTVND